MYEEAIQLSHEFIKQRDEICGRGSSAETEVVELHQKVEAESVTVTSSTAFFSDAEQRVSALRARAGVFSELLDLSGKYMDGMSGTSNAGTPAWSELQKLRRKMGTIQAGSDDEDEDEDEKPAVKQPKKSAKERAKDKLLAERKAKEEAEATVAAAKAAEEVVIEVDVARPVVEGRLREGKGTRESVNMAFEALMEVRTDEADPSWQKLAENKRQQWTLWKAKGSMNKWKASVLMMGITPESVAAVLQSVELRSAWDPFIDSYKLLQKVNEAPHQAYLQVHAKGVMQLQARDLVEYRTVRAMTDGSYQIVYQGCTHGRAPASQRVTRADCVLSGFVIEPYTSEDGELHGCLLFGYSHLEYKGSPALALLREWVKKGPHKWVEAVVAESARWQAKGGGGQQEPDSPLAIGGSGGSAGKGSFFGSSKRSPASPPASPPPAAPKRAPGAFFGKKTRSSPSPPPTPVQALEALEARASTPVRALEATDNSTSSLESQQQPGPLTKLGGYFGRRAKSPPSQRHETSIDL